MKKTLTVFLILISGVIFGQADRNLYASVANVQINEPTYTNVNLSLSNSSVRHKDNYRTSLVAILIAGAAFTTVSILENGRAFGTYYSDPQPGNPKNINYRVQNFWTQTPRQLVFCVGVGLTLAGGIGLIGR